MIGTTLNQRFELQKELGRGGMGTVYRAIDLVLQRNVAIKVLKELTGEEVGKRIRLEAQITARLEHQNVVRLYDFGVDREMYFFVMEEVDGTSFQKRWKKTSLTERVRILADVADALDYAHHKGLIHRDVKPANVLLTSTDQAKLSDFGLSVEASMVQESGIVRGTPHYMSPEQAKGKKLDHRTDIYALGVMLYECATGAPPFSGTLMTIMSQHVNAEPEPPRDRNPDLSADFERYLRRLMAKSPEARPSSCREVAAGLRDLLRGNRLLASGGDSASPATGNGTWGAGSVEVSTGRALATGMVTPRSSGSGYPGVAASAISVPRVTAATGAKTVLGSHAARDMIDAVEAEPIALTPDDRYLCGHYLAYLLGGSRRRGFLMRRPLDPLNADRARLLLAMTYVSIRGDDESVARGAALLEGRADVRPALSPAIVAKYLACRDTPAKRKRFRVYRQQLQQASPYADKHLVDAQGVLNPGLMPQVMEDLRRIAPARTEVDDQLVQRWNRVTEVWLGNPEFRDAVLRYATRRAFLDTASIELWPEVVYPLIERARWQRRLRSGTEVVWDAVAGSLHLPDAGVKMDRVIRQSVPAGVVAKLDSSLDAFVDDPSLNEPEPAAPVDPDAQRLSMHSHISMQSFADIDEDRPTRDLVRLSAVDPVRLTLGELRALWQEGLAAIRQPGGRTGHRHVPIGPYRLSVIASIRSRSAGQVAIQGMPNKQVEMLIPSFSGGGSNSRPILAVWVYANNSLGVTFIDHLGTQRYILWDAGTNQQTNYEDAAEFNHNLFTLGLEVPDQLDRALSKRFRPHNAV